MDYNKESDDNINAAMTEVIFNLNGWGFNESSRVFFLYGLDGVEYYEQQVIDYCNNPADMWPIILENKISLHWGWEIAGECSAIGVTWKPSSIKPRPINHEYTSKNPLRAAAIVFLMMQEA
jgi:hypothetical protein